MMDPGITYFHLVSEKRVEGIAAVRALFDGYRGMPLFDSYEIAQPKVQEAGDVAVLSYLLVTRNGGITRRWNATQVFQKKKEGWRVVHSHFSANNPPQP
jgi:ketosteroid isomerase-like protein